MQSLIFAVIFSLYTFSDILTLNLLNLSKSQEEILQDLSWRIKPTVLNSFLRTQENGNGNIMKRTSIFDGRFGPNFRASEDVDRNVGLLAQLSQQAEESVAAEYSPETAHRTIEDCSKPNGPKEEIAMKTRMFSLMYETVRDTDTKVKRAELIKDYYANNTEFEMGYLMGEATDKYNSMMEVAATVKRLYKEWKPLDHINAYEQISNHAIEINTVIDGILRKYNDQEHNGDVVPPPVAPSRQRYKVANL